MKINLRLLLGSFMILSFAISAQDKTEKFWTKTTEKDLSDLPKARRNSFPSEANYFKLDLAAFKSALVNAPVRGQFNGQSTLIMSFPTASGTFEKFRVMESPIMHPDLTAKYPMIKTYAAQGVDDPTATMRFSVTQFGLHTMTLSGKTSSNFIDPFTSDIQNYIVYNKASLNGTPQTFECLLDDNIELASLKTNSSNTVLQIDDSKLRKYRLAQSCNAEYGNIFAGGSNQVANIQAQMTITINRVNSVYERDLAITLEFIPNNDDVIFYGSTAADPWSGEYNTKTARVLDSIIGVANYDIGHNFNTSGGGNAGCLSCVCVSTSQNATHKGRGYTGSSNPTGDPFDIDYVAHEMGHQFGGYHVMNTCSRSGNGTTEVEPASGSSIMGYAGICGSNVQNNSHDDFNFVNIRDISNNIKTGNSTCAQITALTNLPPTANAGSNYIIPKSTAYILEGTGTDPDGTASLTYNWSQNDPTQSPGNAAPQSTYAVGPLYRAIPPTTSPNRYMPNLATCIANNLSNTWEVTPSVARTMNFSFIVRDNDVNGGQTAADLMTVTVDGASGPFTVTSQGTATTWGSGTSQYVTWNVAGTNAAPVNAANVNIYLSVDGGYTYPYTLASNIPNNGSATVQVPAGITTTTGRLMIRGANNIFFDLNNAAITIVPAEFAINTDSLSQTYCPPLTAAYDLTYNTFFSFNETTTFSATGNPAGTSVTFNPTTATTGGTPVTMTINGLTSAMAGTYTMVVTGTATSVTKTTSVFMNIQNPNPGATTLSAPANGATGVTSSATLSWAAVSGFGMLYDVEVATDAAFTNIITSVTDISTTSYVAAGLLSSTTYYWHVNTHSSCGTGTFSSTFSFTTSSCSNTASANVPVAITTSGTPTITSTLNIPISGTISDINVVDLVGTHSWINDLTVTLKSPANTTVTLWGAICNNQDNFDVNFDDAAAPGALPCPPVGGGTYQPQTPLSAFNGQDPNGTWTLTIADGANLDGGSLDGWGLEICTTTSVGIKKYQAYTSAISIYPNPTTGMFTVRTTGDANEVNTIKIVNSLGQVIEISKVNPNTDHQIDLRSYEAGVYFVTVSNKNQTETRKVILTKD
ncbi:MAG TPA: zinc-dependent metalloprotease family protein [Bacteroidia bacterium]